MPRNLSVYVIALCLIVIVSITTTLITVRIVSSAVAPQAISTSGGTVSSGDVTAMAEQATNSANIAAGVASSIMSFIQSFGALLGLGVIGAVAGGITYILRTVGKYEEEVSKLRDLNASTVLNYQQEVERLQKLNRQQEISSGRLQALTLLQLARQQLELRNYSAAIQALEEAVGIDSDNQAANYLLGELYLQHYTDLKTLERAVEHLKRAVQAEAVYTRYPSADAALAYGIRLIGERETDPKVRDYHFADAEKRFLQALNANPTLLGLNGESWYGALGSLYRRQGRIEQALDAYTRASRVTPSNSYPINNQAILHLKLGNVEQAREVFKRSAVLAGRKLDGDPFDIFARFDELTAYAALEQPEDAQKSLQQALEQTPTEEILLKALYGLNQLKDAPIPPKGLDVVMDRLQQAIASAHAANVANAAAVPSSVGQS